MYEFFHLLWLIVALIVSSCKDQAVTLRADDKEGPSAEVPLKPGYRISMGEARKEVESLAVFLDKQGGKEEKGYWLLSAGSKRIIENGSLISPVDESGNESQPQLYSIDGTPSKENQIPEVYIFNYANDKGFVVMSADKRFPEVLIIAEKGNLPRRGSLENSGLGILLERSFNYLKKKKDDYVKQEDGLVTASQKGYSLYNAPVDEDELYFWERDRERERREREELERATSREITIGHWETIEKVGPLLKTKWGQYSPYNRKVPVHCGYQRAPVGYIPTAMAEIMAYHKWPTSYALDLQRRGINTDFIEQIKETLPQFTAHVGIGEGSTPIVIEVAGPPEGIPSRATEQPEDPNRYLNTTYTWDSWLRTGAPTATDRTTNVDALAQMFYDASVESNINHVCGGSGPWRTVGEGFTSIAPDIPVYAHIANRAFEKMKYELADVNYFGDGDKVMSSLRNKRPVYVCGSSSQNCFLFWCWENNSGSNAWVVDGYYERSKKTTYATRVHGIVTSRRTVMGSSEKFLHVNFGWDGDADGYYAKGMFNASSGPSIREAIDTDGKSYTYPGAKRNYKYKIAALTNLKPKK